MKNLFRLSLVAFLATSTLLVTSCGKYEEGPSVTLLTAKMRIAGDWKMASYTVNGTDYTSAAGSVTVTIDKDGTYAGTAVYTFGGSTVTDNFTGAWEFNDDKTKVTMTETGSSTGEVYDIVMLKNKQMKLKQVSGSNTEIWTYDAQ
jgi:hypothetical protein